MSEVKRVAVIGGGAAGIGSIKALKEVGLVPVCFEQTDNYGGLWRYRDDDKDGVASVMRSTIINTSKELSAISDFPPPAEFPNYMHNTMMIKLIGMTAEKFDCLRHIRFNQRVIRVEQDKDFETTGRWVVTAEHTKTKERTTEVFDGVMVCIGHHVYPNVPTFPGQEKFKGKIMHTHSLKNVDGFENKLVVVVGVGNSGMDAAVEISSVAEKVYLSTRRGTWVMPRVGPKGYPFDAAFLRRYLYILQRLVPTRILRFYMESLLNERFDHRVYNLQPKHGFMSQHPTVSDTLPIKLLSGAVVVRGNIREFTEDGVIFDKEKDETKVDTVVLATGYQIKFPFLSDSVLNVKDNRVELYKFIFPPDLPHPTLAIVGLVQPGGPGFPVGEMQTRWVAAVMSGEVQLPSKDLMHADIRAKDEANRKMFVNSPRHTIQVDYVGYLDELAEIIGVKPNLWKIAFTDPKLFWALMFGPFLSYQYRLVGPRSWDGARDAILNCNERMWAHLKERSSLSDAPPSIPFKSNMNYFFLWGSAILLSCALVWAWSSYFNSSTTFSAIANY